MIKRFFTFVCLLSTITIFCSEPSNAQHYDFGKENFSNSIIQSILDSVNIDSIYHTERHITGEEPFWLNGQLDSIKSRYSYSSGIVKAQNYLQNRFEKLGYTVEIQPFMNTLNNIIATKIGTNYSDQFYILGGHYDSTSPFKATNAPGADDNGSGTSVVLEAARILKNYQYKYSIKFILFSGEEIGKYGSAHYASNAYANDEKIEGFINLDMIGYDGNDDGLFEIHTGFMSESQAIGDLVAANVTNWNLLLESEIYSGSESTERSDHYNFWIWNYPAILIIEDFFDSYDSYPFYHTTEDVLSKLNPDYLLNMAKLSIGSLAVLAEIDSIASGLTVEENIPIDFTLYPPYPNPFNPIVNIKYDLPKTEHVQVTIFDALGNQVKTLVDQKKNEGTHQIIWNSINSNGESVASGVYFVLIKTNNFFDMKKIILMR